MLLLFSDDDIAISSPWTIFKDKNVHINLVNIQVTDSKVSLDAPMRFLTKIPHNIYTQIVIRNMNCFTIRTSNYCWWPPAYMLEKIWNLITMKFFEVIYTWGKYHLLWKSLALNNIMFSVPPKQPCQLVRW